VNTAIEDLDEVRALVQLYIEGSNGDTVKLRQAFHPEARMAGHLGDDRDDDGPIAEFIERIDENPGLAGPNFQAVIRTIDLTGKTVTGFANFEEDCADEATWPMGVLPRGTHIMPWRIEDELKKLGANFIQAGLWKGFAVRDGNLITGQQNFSGAETAAVIVKAPGE